MGFGLDDVTDLADSIQSGDFGDVVGDIAGIAGDVLEQAAPVVSMFNPALGAAMSVGGSVLSAVEDGEITLDEVVDIGQKVIQANGWGGLLGGVGENFEAMVGLDKIVGEKVGEMVGKLINGESMSKGDVDSLQNLLSLLNQMNMKEADRAGKKGGEAAAGEGGGEGGEAAGGAGGAGGAKGTSGAPTGGSIFQVIAQVFGEKMEEALGEMLAKAEEIAGAEDEEVGKLTPQFTAAAQQFSFLSQSFNTGIAALGEGLKSASRRQ